jgi:hypothetical protein
MKDTATMLTTLQKNVADQNNGLTMSFALQGTQVSPQLRDSQSCSFPDLLSDARAQAQKLAGASGATVGAILAMSNSTATMVSSSPVTISIGRFFSSSLLSPSACVLTVKFAVKF